jgi:glucan-binding YG repeat protein
MNMLPVHQQHSDNSIQGSMNAWGEEGDELGPRKLEPDGPYAEIGAGDTAIAAGLKRIGDVVSRRVLPWQAACCPRAVEGVRDTRQLLMQQKHEEFLHKMAAKLEDKVAGFLSKKDEEVELWLRGELLAWRKSIGDEDKFVAGFIKEDLARLSERALMQEEAQKERDSRAAYLLDDQERDDTREQLATFRKLCRADSKQQADLRDLHSTLEHAHTKVSAGVSNNKRLVMKRMEDAHDWLCCLSDNALTASESERVLAQLSTSIDSERTRAFKSLEETIASYTEQHNAIVEAIMVFTNRIRHHASDYLRREQLIGRAFYHYLNDVINGASRTYSSEHHRHGVAWEGKYMQDRSLRREQLVLRDYNLSLAPFEKLAHDLRDRMKLQLERITSKMQAALTGQDNDISKRKGAVHRLLAKHVNSACSSRRQKLKGVLTARKDEFEMEEKCINSVNDLCKELRVSIDQMWVKQHLRERRMYEAESGRMVRLEKSALIIWNQHAHLAIREKEDYELWLQEYKESHRIMLDKRHDQVRYDWRTWRASISLQLFDYQQKSRSPIWQCFEKGVVIDASTTLDRVIYGIGNFSSELIEKYIHQVIVQLQLATKSFIEARFLDCDDNLVFMETEFKRDWNSRLTLLNRAVNRRIGRLKEMEAALEESISETLLQHEVEATLFEQNSCACLEEFWVEQRSRMHSLTTLIKNAQVDFEIARHSGKKGNREYIKDKVVDMALQGATMPTLPPLNANEEETRTSSSSARFDQNKVATDSDRLKSILDEIRPDFYREFTHKMTRGLEKMKRDYGEGKKRLVAVHHVCKVLFSAADLFWDRARLSARCVGKVACRGTVLFMNGMPTNCRAQFCIGVALFVISSVKSSYGKVDCQDIFNLMERGLKKVFIVGLYAITMQLGSFGSNMLTAECMWACSVCSVPPPVELLQAFTSSQADKLNLEAQEHSKKLAAQYATSSRGSFFTDDPVDLVNSVLAVKERRGNHNDDENEAETAAMRPSSPGTPGSPQHTSPQHTARGQDQGESEQEPTDVLDLTELISVKDFLLRIQSNLPGPDISVYLALLGRADGMMEITPHRFCQAVLNWRRAAIAATLAAVEAPGPEYSRIHDVVSEHMIERATKRRVGFSNVSCISPFEAMTHVLDWMTSIKCLPISTVQALCLITRAGSCDPWLEDPFLHFRKGRFPDEVKELVDLFFSRDLGGDSTQIPAYFSGNIASTIEFLDVNKSGRLPLELLRSYIDRDDVDLMNSMVSACYWSICRGYTSRESTVEAYGPATGVLASAKAQLDNFHVEDNAESSAEDSVRPLTEQIATSFNGSAEYYMKAFSGDVTRILSTIPFLDCNVISGMPATPISADKAHGVVTHAIKLDASARNAVPMSCCVWQGTKVIPIKEAINAVAIVPAEVEIDYDNVSSTLGNEASVGGGSMEGDGSKFPLAMNWKSASAMDKLSDLRTEVEISLLARYALICDNIVSDSHYSAVGAPAITTEKDQWKELADRRLGRVDKMTIAWRNTMMNEWTNSLYQSRRRRYGDRASAVKTCVDTYLAQYDVLRNSIVEERNELMRQIPPLFQELADTTSMHKQFFGYHGEFLKRTLERLEGHVKDGCHTFLSVLKQYQRFCGTIKRHGIDRLKIARDKLEHDLLHACKSLITAYKGGYAQSHFDDLVQRGNVWRTTASTMHGDIIGEKEKFVVAKENVHRELGVEVTDCLTIDRNRTRSLLQDLTDDSSAMQNALAVTRAGYTTVQQDANARIVIRIERALREARKLRTAAEQEHSLEGPVISEIRSVLGTTYTTCLSIVDQIKEASMAQLKTVEPLRMPHRDKMCGRLASAEMGWKELKVRLQALLDNFRNEAFTLLGAMKVQCIEAVNVYDQTESIALSREYRSERAALIAAFRKHFTEYDLSEAAIFERFNVEVRATVAEMRTMFGASKPDFISAAAEDLLRTQKEAVSLTHKDIKENLSEQFTDRDDSHAFQIMEVTDALVEPLASCYDAVLVLPDKYTIEKSKQLRDVAAQSMYNNGDMIKPQVQAVIDLLIMGIEIETDFTKGYDSLIGATNKKSKSTMTEVNEFVDRLSDPAKPTSIDAAVQQIQNRVDQRQEEIDTLLEASNTHIIADHSHMDVLSKAAEKDIDDWVTLTKQLIENSFKDAEARFLSSLWPTPPASPRMDVLPEEEDRVARIKALLKAHQEGTIPRPKKKRKPVSEASLAGDLASVKVAGKPDEYIEMQDGWLECYTEDGFVYYYNPKTNESLWDLPASLKIPVADDESVRLIDTPRSQVAGERADTNIMVVTPRELDFPMLVHVDNVEIISQVTSDAKAVAAAAIEVAINITSVLRKENRSRHRPTMPHRALDVDEDSEAIRTAPTVHATAAEYDPNHTGDASVALSEGTSYRREMDLLSEVLDDDTSAAPLSDIVVVGVNRDLLMLGIAGDDENSGILPGGADADVDSSIAGRDGDMGSVTTGGVSKAMSEAANVEQARAEERFREVRENDLMFREDISTAAWLAETDTTLKRAFGAAVHEVVQRDSVYQSHVDNLKLMAKQLRKLTIIEVLADEDTTWERLAVRVFETQALEEEARKLAERLKTDAGKKRQKMILEHAEDIDELAQFFREKAGLSKTNSRNAATEAVLKNISTAKKLAKNWARKQLNLAELGLDSDDIEEVEHALQAIINSGGVDPMAQSMQSMTSYLPQQSNKSLQPAAQSFHSQQQLQVQSQKGQPAAHAVSPGFYLDPAYVTEVDSTIYDQHVSPHTSQVFQPEHLPQQQPALYDHYQQPTAAAAEVAPDVGATSHDSSYHGYRSFTNNWIECYSEEGHAYYYNTVTGESSWELPAGCMETCSGYSADGYYNEHGEWVYHQQDHGAAAADHHHDPGEVSPRGPGRRSPRGNNQEVVGKRGPLPNIPEVNVNCKTLGIDRQMSLLAAQDRWQNCLVKCQFFITEQKALYIKGKEEMFAKVSQRVDSRLATFVDDIKYMQRSLKKELGDLSASERDLRRMFEEDSVDVVHAEKLTFVLEAIDKLRENTSTKYEAAHKQLGKFVDDWNLIETELLQVGDIFDESTVSNLEQMRMTCEHAAKVFVYDQMKSINEIRVQELKIMRSKLTEIFRQDTMQTQEARIAARAVQQQQLQTRAQVKKQLTKEWGQGWDKEIEDELIARNLRDIDEDSQIRTEEEIMLSYLVQEVKSHCSIFKYTFVTSFSVDFRLRWKMCCRTTIKALSMPRSRLPWT